MFKNNYMMIFYFHPICFTFSISYSVVTFHLAYVFQFLHLLIFFDILFQVFFKNSRQAFAYISMCMYTHIFSMHNMHILENMNFCLTKFFVTFDSTCLT